MNKALKNKLKVSIIDLYNNERNEGMRCIEEIVSDISSTNNQIDLSCDVFETRFKDEIPPADYDIYVSSGGPGSPFEGEGSVWEKKYFNLLDKIWSHNQKSTEKKKYVFFICHSFQMMARYFKLGLVSQRYEKSFGVIPFIKTADGIKDPLLNSLPEPFYAADFRTFQVTQPDKNAIDDLDAKILSLEVPEETGTHESAIMAARISNEIAGTQFHPEADAASMIFHLKQDARKKQIVDKYGEQRYLQMLELLEQDDAIKLTRKTVLPAFLNAAVNELISVPVT